MTKTQKSEALQKAKPVTAKKHLLKMTALQKAKAKAQCRKKPAKNIPGKTKKSLEKDQGLTKDKLDQLGSLSLEEKVKAVAENAETEEEAASALQKAMTKAEKNKCWSKHNTYLKHHPEEKEALEKANKTEKGLASALFLLRKEGKKYLSVKSKVSAEESLQKTEEWETEKEMLAKFSDVEFQRHLASGRVVWRNDPTTWDCYEYCDTKKFKKTVNVGRKKQWEEGQEFEPTEQEEASYAGLYHQAMGLQGDALASLDSLGKGFDLAKGKGKGKEVSKGKGKGKGKNTGKGKQQEQLALEDGQVESQEEDEEETEKETLKKVKKARDACTTSLSNLELALQQAQDQLSAAGKSFAESLQDDLRAHLSQLKEVLLSKALGSKELKQLLKDAAAAVKSGNKECKELNHLANKAESVAASKVSKKSKRS